MAYLGLKTFERAYNIRVDIEDDKDNEVGADTEEDPFNDDQLSDEHSSKLKEIETDGSYNEDDWKSRKRTNYSLA